MEEMEKIIIRAVDSGNIQRSPTFQAIFNYALSTNNDYPLQIEFDSAGIDVDAIMKNQTPALKKLSILDAGLYYDLLTESEKKLTQELLDSWFHKNEEDISDEQKEIITKIYVANKTKIHTIQMKFRNDALLEAGIPIKFLPGMRTPFRNHDDLKLVLPVERKVVAKVEKYFQDIGDDKKPKIILYGDIVGVEPLADELKGGMETARKQVNYFMNTKDKAMEAFIELL